MKRPNSRGRGPRPGPGPGPGPDPNPEPMPFPTPQPHPRPRPGPGPDPLPPLAGGLWVQIGTPVIIWRQSAEGAIKVALNLPMTQVHQITKAADQLHEFQKKARSK